MSRRLSLLLLWVCLTSAQVFSQDAATAIVQGGAIGGTEASIQWRVEGFEPRRAVLFRSTRCKYPALQDPYEYPVVPSSLPAAGSGSMVDDSLAHGVKYYYQARFETGDGRTVYSNVARVEMPAKALPALSEPYLIVNKAAYCLEVRESGRLIKRYPVALGQNPVNRKLHQDNASTPEGVYEIVGLQPQATYYKAMDIDYPNEVDRFRYRFAERNQLLPSDRPGIGGEIQIHGDVKKNQEVLTNWTHGCIAMRNSDLNELFGNVRIQQGVRVFIVGRNLSWEDLRAIYRARTSDEIRLLQERLQAQGFPATPDKPGVLGPGTMEALGRYQVKMQLPVTCQPDRQTETRLLAGLPPSSPAKRTARDSSVSPGALDGLATSR